MARAPPAVHTRTRALPSPPPVQMFYDELPVWGFIGKVEKQLQTGTHKYFLFTHFHFDLSYNDNRVIEINVSSDPVRTVDISTTDDLDVQFSYSVKWKETSIPFDHRMDRYARYSFLPQHLEVRCDGWGRGGGSWRVARCPAVLQVSSPLLCVALRCDSGEDA